MDFSENTLNKMQMKDTDIVSKEKCQERNRSADQRSTKNNITANDIKSKIWQTVNWCYTENIT